MMTICVAVAVFDGIVFAADSAASLIGQDPHGNPVVTNVYRNGNKVFNLVRGLPIVSMTCGMGNFGRAPVAVLTKDLRRAMAMQAGPFAINVDNYTLREVAEKAKAFFEGHYTAITPPPMGPHTFDYWIGGFGSGSNSHEIWSIKIENGTCHAPVEALPADQCGLVWGGQPEAINRLVTGFSPGLAQAMVLAGLPAATVPQLLAAARATTEVPLAMPAMPIQDAIELAEFLVDVTKRFVRFLPGADTVGGDTDIAVVTRHERFKWIKRKHYYTNDLNPLETDHV